MLRNEQARCPNCSRLYAGRALCTVCATRLRSLGVANCPVTGAQVRAPFRFIANGYACCCAESRRQVLTTGAS